MRENKSRSHGQHYRRNYGDRRASRLACRRARGDVDERTTRATDVWWRTKLVSGESQWKTRSGGGAPARGQRCPPLMGWQRTFPVNEFDSWCSIHTELDQGTTVTRQCTSPLFTAIDGMQSRTAISSTRLPADCYGINRPRPCSMYLGQTVIYSISTTVSPSVTSSLMYSDAVRCWCNPMYWCVFSKLSCCVVFLCFLLT